MRKILRGIVFAVIIAGIAYYLYGVLTYTPTSDFEVGIERWMGGAHFGGLITAIVVASFGLPLTGSAFAGLAGLMGKNTGQYVGAPVGIGQVLSVSQTGMQINDQPVVRLDLDVTGAHGERFRSTAKTIVPITQLAQLQPGVALPVRYIPGKTDEVELDRSGDEHAAQAAIEQAMLASGLTTRDALAIHHGGVAAKGVITSLNVPGQIEAGRPKLELEIVVSRPDGSTFQIHKEPFVPSSAVRHLQVGSVVDVRYLPHDESQTVIEVPAA